MDKPEDTEELKLLLSKQLLKELELFKSDKINISRNLKSELPELNKRESKFSNISKIQEYYKSNNLVLVLGAGVSMDFGIPNWNTLLQKLLLKTIQEYDKASNLLAELFNDVFSPSPLIAGRYLQNHFDEIKGKDRNFIEAVRNALYENIERNKSTNLLDEILNYCISPGKSPNLDCIITYNYDDILEEKLSELNFEVPFKSIYATGMNPEYGELPIYHVHGYLPRKAKLTDQNTITLGEATYHDQYLNTYNWNNLVQLNKFIEKNCVFIGSSLTDPNIRRLLDIARKHTAQENSGHFVIKKHYDQKSIQERITQILGKKDKEERNITTQALDDFSEILIEIIEKFEENDLLTLGVNTVWVNSYEEIPKTLIQIRSNSTNA